MDVRVPNGLKVIILYCHMEDSSEFVGIVREMHMILLSKALQTLAIPRDEFGSRIIQI